MVARSSKRAYLLFGSLLLVAGGIAWSVLGDVARDAEGGLPTAGYISSVRRDSIGCESRLPFAARDCRYLIRIHHRVGAVEQTTTIVEKRYFRPLPLAGGEPVSGTCAPGGRCRFEQLAERPWALYGVLGSLAAAALVAAWLLRRPRGPAA